MSSSLEIPFPQNFKGSENKRVKTQEVFPPVEGVGAVDSEQGPGVGFPGSESAQHCLGAWKAFLGLLW